MYFDTAWKLSLFYLQCMSKFFLIIESITRFKVDGNSNIQWNWYLISIYHIYIISNIIKTNSRVNKLKTFLWIFSFLESDYHELTSQLRKSGAFIDYNDDPPATAPTPPDQEKVVLKGLILTFKTLFYNFRHYFKADGLILWIIP